MEITHQLWRKHQIDIYSFFEGSHNVTRADLTEVSNKQIFHQQPSFQDRNIFQHVFSLWLSQDGNNLKNCPTARFICPFMGHLNPFEHI